MTLRHVSSKKPKLLGDFFQIETPHVDFRSIPSQKNFRRAGVLPHHSTQLNTKNKTEMYNSTLNVRILTKVLNLNDQNLLKKTAQHCLKPLLGLKSAEMLTLYYFFRKKNNRKKE